MKKVFIKIVIVCFLIQILFIGNGRATTIHIDGAYKDTLYSYCQLPSFHEFEWSGSTAGYLPTDSISVHVYFGDGYDTIIKSLNYHANPNDFFLGETTHTYTLSGTYTMKFVATGPDGNADSLIQVNWFTLTDSCTTTDITNIVNISSNISIFPNPASTLLNIHQSSPSPNQQLIITDLLGNEVYKETLTGIDNSISIATFSNGIYFYEVRGQMADVRGKFVVQK